MKLAREAWPTIGGLILMIFVGWFVSPCISIALLIPLGIVVWFFRDPERTPDSAEGFLSPADGKVVF